MSPAAKIVARMVALAVVHGLRSRQGRISVEEQAPWLFQNRQPKRRRKPPEAGMPVPAVPPRGPLPMQGGAEAPLDFGRD
ncbi:hypothetical protein AAJ72_13785 [Citromicrobium sp. RCC1885]|uniref:hypothetical protein n=2 Tax=Sphingomonadaceae TaxID=41297 RepID=UPI0006C9329E|nr:hypothetical protein [Citromicrobium sp. RCC1897]KPM21717.1 hypothetical protein AAJ72_13785 [Citromicrobium sp. RCC1885]KPM23653.1 hypothetical protein AAJ74_14840 [Citromicrobium sp. RCC1878]MAO05217.1 hypothetical protein [Citromicrobium sp.]OAM06867.1 hypothetical protein A0U43_14765 [Citromicrobium sp. RCC1897]